MHASELRGVFGAQPLHFFNDNCSIELRVLDYQYPQNTQDQYDADWLRIEGTVTHPQGNWRFNDPCLLTWEASALASWLDDWAASTKTKIGFIEPNLSFAKIDSDLGALLRIFFELESRPPWAENRFVGASDTWLDLPLKESAAKAAAGMYEISFRGFPSESGRENLF